MKKTLLLSLIIAISSGLFITCKKDKGDPPLLPTYSTMIIDFSNFNTQKKSAFTEASVKGTETSTWDFAAAIAGVWSTLISANLEIPYAAFHASAGNNPSYVSDKLWQWSYNFTVSGTAYKARITGQITAAQVLWKMYLTKDGTGGFTDFVWMEGTSKNDATQGQWIFYQSPQINTKLFQTDWVKAGTTVSSIKYTYLKNDTNKDSYVTYILTSEVLNAGFNIHFGNALYSDSEIQWNSTTKEGRLKCPDYLQDQNWYCWDSNKLNALCQ